jgi:hypothetical protein
MTIRTATLGDDSEEWLKALFPHLVDEARKRDESTVRFARDVRDIARSAARDLIAEDILARAEAQRKEEVSP